MPARLIRIRLDDATWASGTSERRLEWRAAIRDLLDSHRFDVEHGPFAMAFTWRGGGGEVVATVEGVEVARMALVPADLRPPLDEYLGVCRRLAHLEGGAGDPQLEALDIAKRICHDEGGEVLQALCRALAPDHATGRRLFTLVVTLDADTTRLGLGELGERRRPGDL